MVARGRRPDAAALLLAAALVAAGDDRVRAGTWGGRHIGMEVTEGGASVEYQRFLRPTVILAPRVYRFGIKMDF